MGGNELKQWADNEKKAWEDLSDTIKNALANAKKSKIETPKIKTPEIDTDNIAIKIANLKSDIKEMKTIMSNYGPGEEKFNRYAVAIDKAEKELKDLQREQKNAENNSKSLNNSFSGFDKAISKIKRLGLSLFGIRSIYSLVSKASSAYLSQDTDLAGKLQSVWAGLGAFLEPIISKIANWLIKLVSYLNVFIKAVTGQDLLAKASAKATDKIKKQTKATKELNKSLSTLDEITNINKDENKGTKDQIENPFANFENVKLDTEWSDKIKKFGEWIRDNWQLIAFGIGGIVLAITGLKIAMKVGEFTPFSKALLGVGLICVGIVGFIYYLKKYIDDLKKGLENTTEGWKHFGKMLSFVGIGIVGIGILFSSIPLIIAGAVVIILGVLASFWPKIYTWLENAKNSLQSWAEKVFGKTAGSILISPITSAIDLIQDLFGGLFRGIKGILNGIILIFKGDFANGFKSIGKGLVNFLITMLNVAIDALNIFVAPIRGIILAIGKAMGKSVSMKDIKIPRVSYLDTGTGYVPEDQLAYIHKGEAVIPKKFNSAEYFNNINNNEETNALLLDLNRTLIEVRDKDNSLYVNGKELARTTYNDFKNEEQRLGSSSVVKVR